MTIHGDTKIINKIIKIIQNEEDYLNKYIDCDMYSNDFMEININNLIEEIGNKLNTKIENNCIIYNNKRIRIIQSMNNENWISYKYEIIYE